MSFRPGSFSQPDAVETGGASTAAPQRGQLSCDPSNEAPHQGQVAFAAECWMEGGGAGGGSAAGMGGGGGTGAAARFTWEPQDPQKFAASEILLPQLVQNILDLLHLDLTPRSCLLGFVMHVHRLHADPAGPGHPRQAHVRAAEKSGAQFLKLHLHRNRGVFV
jgi:hypothetical protein